MSKTTIGDRCAASCMKLHLFMEGEIQLTEAQFERLQDDLMELLEESNNHRYRFGRTIPRSE